MKRFHVHVGVSDLPASIRFYSSLFGHAPSIEKPDYAKWMLEDPRVNFAISTQGKRPGLDHLGIQADSAAELAELQGRLNNAELPVASQSETTCCYAKSDKHWTIDPQNIAWESFHTLDSAPTFNAEAPAIAEQAAAAGCCIPLARTGTDKGACCVTTPASSCCA